MSDEAAITVREEQLRRACADLDRRRRKGEVCWAESFLSSCPSLDASEECAVELIYTEFVVREELGEKPEPGEYLARFPHWAEALARQFDVHAALRAHREDSSLTLIGPRLKELSPLKTTELAASPDMPPRQIGPYDILDEVARGAMGVVYKAQHRFLRRTVALKMVLAGTHAAPAALARFQTEAEAAARLQHPNIVQIYDVGSFEGRPYLALEYIDGGSLASRLSGQSEDPRRAAKLVQTVARAVDYAHRRGIIHRDLKPGNILLKASGLRSDARALPKQTPLDFDLWVPKVADFGLAKFIDRGGPQSESGAIFGTPSYMAPEQARGQNRTVGAAADVHALGAILYELLTGRPPFRADNMLTTLQQVASEEPVPPDRLQADLPRDLAIICLKCLHKDPTRRYTGARALAADLQRFLSGEPIVARPVSHWERGWKWARRRPSLAALVCTLTLAAVALLGISLSYNARLRSALTVSDQRAWEARLATADASRQRQEAEDKGAHLQEAVQKLRRQSIEHQAVIEDLRRNRAALQTAYEKIEQKNAEASTALAKVKQREAQARRQAKLLAEQGDRLREQVSLTRQLVYAMQLNEVERTWPTDPAQAQSMLEDATRCPPELRDFAWGMYHYLCKQDQVTTSLHGPAIRTIASSPDGKMLATAGGDDTIELWDGRVFRERAVLQGHDARVACLAFSPDGRLLASGSEDHTIRLWDVNTGQTRVVLSGHAAAVRCVAFASDGSVLASGAEDRTIRLWNVRAGTTRLTLTSPTGPVQALRFSPKGDLLTSAGADGTVRVWDIVTLAFDKERSHAKLDLQGAVKALALSADGLRLAVAAGAGTTVDLFDVRGDELTRKASLRGHVDAVRAITFSADGRFLATGSDDQTVRLWELANRSPCCTLKGHKGAVLAVAFAADKRSLVSAGDGSDLRTWSLPTRLPDLFQPAGESSHRIAALAFAPDSQLVASAGDGEGVELIDPSTMHSRGQLPGHAGPVSALAFGTTSRELAVAFHDGVLQRWDVVGRRPLGAWTSGQKCVYSVRYSPDGRTLATGGADGTVKLWDVAGHREIARLVMAEPVLSLGFSPDGMLLVSGNASGQVTLWNVRSRASEATMIEHDKAVLFTEFSPDGKLLATGGSDNTVKLWDRQTLALKSTLTWTAAGNVFAAAFSPDGKTLALGGGSRTGRQVVGEVKLWDVASGQCRATLSGQSGPVAFAPNGTALATVHQSGSLRLWRADR